MFEHATKSVVEGEGAEPRRQPPPTISLADGLLQVHDCPVARQPLAMATKGARGQGQRRVPAGVDRVVAENGHFVISSDATLSGPLIMLALAPIFSVTGGRAGIERGPVRGPDGPIVAR